MAKYIYIPQEKLTVLKEYTDPDDFTIGSENGEPVGGGYAHIQKKPLKEHYGRPIDWDNVDSIHFTVDPEFSDDEELQEYMNDNEVPYDVAKLNNTYFDIEFFDISNEWLGDVSDTYECVFDPNYSEIEDDVIQNLILTTWKENPNQKDYKIDDIQYNRWANCDNVDEAAKHLFTTTNEYYYGAHGFVLRDGTIVLMGAGGDHNEITILNGVESKWQFVEMGNPSIYSNCLRVGGILTSEQEDIIGRMIRSYSDDEIYVSFFNGPKGEQSCKYTRPNYRRVFADIERYYEDGMIPLGESVEKKVITEGLSQILYHYEPIEGLVALAENGYFEFSHASGYDYKYYLSTTRQLNSTIGYPSPHNNASMHQGAHDQCIVRFTLDGKKLSYNYKGIQYNHFPIYNANDKTEKAKAKIGDPLNYIESEDRIISNNWQLPTQWEYDEDEEAHENKSAWDYILRVEILVRPIEIDEIYNPYPGIRDLFEELIDLDVYAEVYFDEKEFNKLNRHGQPLSSAIYTIEDFMYDLLPCEDEEEDNEIDESVQLTKENVESEVEDNEVNLSSFKKQPTLAPKIWKDGDKLNSKVRMKLLQIADDFWETVNINWVEPQSIILTGSICNFNWSKYSDIDLHLLVDFTKIDERVDFVQEYFDGKKNEWNETHSNLKIYGYPVELYVQDIHDIETSGGRYDLENNLWIIHPQENSIHDINGDKYEIKHLAAKLMTKIDNLFEALSNSNSIEVSYQIGKEAKKLLGTIKKMRKHGLDRQGESDPLNIVYKCLKRTDYLDKLWHISSEAYDKVNSIYESVKNLKNLISEEVVADGNAEHNMYAKRWKQEREDLKNFLLHNGKMMTSKENGKRYFVYYDTTMSELIGNNYAVCLQYNPLTMKPSGTVYIRALDKFTDVLFTPQYDTRGRDNISGTNDDTMIYQ